MPSDKRTPNSFGVPIKKIRQKNQVSKTGHRDHCSHRASGGF